MSKLIHAVVLLTEPRPVCGSHTPLYGRGGDNVATAVKKDGLTTDFSQVTCKSCLQVVLPNSDD